MHDIIISCSLSKPWVQNTIFFNQQLMIALNIVQLKTILETTRQGKGLFKYTTRNCYILRTGLVKSLKCFYKFLTAQFGKMKLSTPTYLRKELMYFLVCTKHIHDCCSWRFGSLL